MNYDYFLKVLKKKETNMQLDEIQQIIKTFENKKHILITTKANPDGDAICSSLAFYLLARKLGKKADIVIDNKSFGINPNFNFLPEYSLIQSNIPKANDMVLEFDIGDNNINGLTYKVKNNKLMIRMFPNNKNMRLSTPRIKQESYSHDLIVVLDACDLDSLGNIYDEHTEFFYHTPIINIDHKAENEHFGELNLIELTATATTEILFALTETLDKNFLDEKISTCLLAGIIHESKSFQTNSITPRTLAIA
ncbi:DHH family phosphoesterase, partial [Patescibacteria group bacterium]|nr:DHH family phosphoesterase [Patescibacteria group bacterium]